MSRSTTAARATSSRRSATTTRAASSRRSSWSMPRRTAAPTPSSCRSVRTARCTPASFFDQPYDNESSFGRTYGEHREALELSPRRACRAAGARTRDRHHVLRDRVRLRERRPPRGARRAGVQVRVGRHPQHAAAASRRRVREADDSLDRRRGDGGHRPRGRGDPAAQRPALRPAVHRRLSRRHGRPEPERDHDVARAVPGPRDRALRSPERHRDGARRLHARRARDREALHAESRGEGNRPCVLADAGGNAEARARPAARSRRARRRRQASARDRGGADPEDGQEARRGARARGRTRADGGRRRDQVSGGQRPAAVRARRTSSAGD